MKSIMYKSTVKFHPQKATYVVNMEGYFNGDFFSAVELKERAETAYNQYRHMKYLKDEKGVQLYEDIYNICEVMRVNLLNYSQKKTAAQYNEK